MDFETYQNLYKKECPGCGEMYEAKRTNQTFCTLQCKNRYHNNRQRVVRLKTQKVNQVTSSINQILWSNRQLLKDYVGQNVYYNDLKAKGFQLKFLTHQEQISPTQMRRFVYDMAYEVYNSEENPNLKIFKIFQA